MNKYRISSMQFALGIITSALVSCSGPTYTESGVNAGSSTPSETTFSEFSQVLVENPAFPEAAVRSAYRAILQREGDDGGVAGHADVVAQNGVSGWILILKIFATSEEFETSVRPNSGNRDILESLYMGFLNRGVDPDGANGHLSEMRQGRLVDVVTLIGTANEFYNRIFPYAQMDEAKFGVVASRIYATLLGRAPNANELEEIRVNLWWDGIHGVYQLIDSILNSPEFNQGSIAKMTAVSLANRLFQTLVVRAPTSAELNKVSALISSGKLSRATFSIVSGAEFFSKL